MKLFCHLHETRCHHFLGQLGELKTHVCLTPKILTRGHITLPGTLLYEAPSIELNTPILGRLSPGCDTGSVISNVSFFAMSRLYFCNHWYMVVVGLGYDLNTTAM
jgi:hypothetical protein